MIAHRGFANTLARCVVLLAVSTGAARGADAGKPPSDVPILARHGGLALRAGLFVHDPLSPERGSVDLTAQALLPKAFRLEDPVLDALVPRASFGGTLSLGGRTSHVHAGLAWTVGLSDRLFLEATIGFGINNGQGGIVGPGRNPLGCNWNFFENLSLGYHIGGGWSVLGTVEHISNGGLCRDNRGLTNVGVRLGRAF